MLVNKTGNGKTRETVNGSDAISRLYEDAGMDDWSMIWQKGTRDLDWVEPAFPEAAW